MQDIRKDPLEDIDLNLILKHVPGYIYWKNLQSVYMGCNQNLAQISGLKSPADIVGKTDYDFVWGHDKADRFLEDDQYVINTGNVHFSKYTLPILTQSGLFMTVLTEKRPLLDENNKIIGILAIAMDITDPKEAERLKLERETEQVKLTNALEFQRIASQGVHDIRSPVDALLMTLKNCPEIPETTRFVLKGACQRIQDIAEHLLDRCKRTVFKSIAEEEAKPLLISTALFQILSEKRYRYQELPIAFQYNFSSKSYFAFINIDQNHFKRMMSNLFNNAVEAIGQKKGTVSLSMDVKAEHVIIRLQDNGYGMSPTLVNSILMNRIFTKGKQSGRGIGLTQVKDTLKRYKGDFKLNSRPGKGTEVTLTFPIAPHPSWIANEINLKHGDTVVVLDDDPTIHEAWKSRFKVDAPQISLKHFNVGEETIEFINSLSNDGKQKTVLLADYELLKQKYSGLEVITQAQNERSILVTNNLSDEIMSDAKKIGVKILPKLLAAEVPFLFQESVHVTVC